MARSKLLVAPSELAGEWSFRRRLADLPTGRFGSAEGTLTLDPVRRVWSESGQLTWSGRRAPMRRTMGFAFFAGEWWMTFADGRAFHPWRLGEVVEHPCRSDVYRGLLVLDRAADRPRIGWDVTGPGKHQRIITLYQRVDGAAVGGVPRS